MLKHQALLYWMVVLALTVSGPIHAQEKGDTPVTDEMLLNPDPADWLMFSRTYDNQRFSPLNQINRQNVGQLKMAWSRGMHPGTQEGIPLVHNGVMYVANPDVDMQFGIVQALDATNGDLIWEYKRELPEDLGENIARIRVRTLAISEDKVYYATPDGFVVALGLGDGELHWETKAHDYKVANEHSTGPMVAKGKVITGRNCDPGPQARENCFIAAHDAETGKEVWKFYVPAGNDEPGGDTWGGQPEGSRMCTPWGLPSSYDKERNVVYWGVGNPSPHTRYLRHDGKPFAVPLTTPSELYCNSTLALDVDTGKLVWYYQHVAGDDWDSDWPHERVLFSSKFDPDPKAVKWFNPNVKRGETRDMVASVGENGGLWVLDRATGEFLWAIPFPFDDPLFYISDVDGSTGKTSINPAMVLTKDKEQHTICFSDTKGYYAMAYHPGENALYIPYHDTCLTRTGALSTLNGHSFKSFIRTGADADDWTGIAKVNMETGKMEKFHAQRNPTNGAVLATAGELIFWGDMNRRFYAFDAKSGEVLWESIVGGIVQNSTITYSVNGKQYVAIMTGDGVGHTGKLALVPELKTPRGHNAVYVFALPE